MEHIWAPWRGRYIEGRKEAGCIFCVKPRLKKDAENYIVRRGSVCFAMLNLYPYNNGHLLLAPYRHVGRLDKLDDAEMLELMQMVRDATIALTHVYKPEGFNIGVNAGEVAGAGFGDHIHVHVVPRWAQDTNFMPVIADTRVISEALEQTYERLLIAWTSQTA